MAFRKLVDQSIAKMSTHPTSGITGTKHLRIRSKFVPQCEPPSASMVHQLESFLNDNRHILVVTGAGISTESGIPDYRSPDVGLYARKNYKPMQYTDFIKSATLRQRYWARSYVGWPGYSSLRPTQVHETLASWEKLGIVHWLITQNVDSLHRKAGSEKLSELHGTLYEVACRSCRTTVPRHEFQTRIEALNPLWTVQSFEIATDGDVFLTDEQVKGFQVPACADCGGDMMPRIVFFGDNVQRTLVSFLFDKVAQCDAVLVLGSSLQVYSSYRFVAAASEQAKPIAIVSIGETRADKLASLKIEARCGEILSLVSPRPIK